MKVSICIPTFNQAKYIELAVRSAANQTYSPFEIIVSNDCSTDNTKEVLNSLKTELSLLTILDQPVNLGISKNTDACLRAATGDIIIRLDSDDYLAADYTQVLLNLLNGFPDAGYAHAAIQEIDQHGELLNQRKLYRKEIFQTGDEALAASLKGYRVAANIIMFRRAALEKVNFITGRPDFGEDYHLTTAISAAGFGNVYSNEILAFYRVWVDQAKVRQKRKIAEIDGLRRVFEDVIEPAFAKRNWDLIKPKKSRTALAITHSDCLSWSIYNPEEKKELLAELKKLSSASSANTIALLHLKGFGKYIEYYNKLKAFPKKIIKRLLIR